MHPHLSRLLAVALVLILCQGATKQGQSTLVRDGKGSTAIPTVESGGHRVTHGQSPMVPYSMIGAISADNHWYPACVSWPWRMLRSFSLRRPVGRGRPHVISIADFPHGLPLLP